MESLPFERFREATGERQLAELFPPGVDCFRLSVRHSFGDHQIIRVQMARGRPARLTIHVAPMSEHVADIGTAEAELEDRHWPFLMRVAEFVGFWELSPDRPGERGLDGVEYAIEGLVGGQYHRVERWSPSAGRSGEFVSVLCRYLLELGDYVFEQGERAQPGAAPDRGDTTASPG